MRCSTLYPLFYFVTSIYLVKAAPNLATKDNQNPQGLSIPLTLGRQGRKTPEEKASWAWRQALLLVVKYGANIPGVQSGSKMKRATGTNDLVNHNQDSSYFGSLAIGTPAEAFNVILDTGSSDMWIASSSCHTGCSGVPMFDPHSSSSFVNLSQPFSIAYGSGSASGLLVKDTVQMAGFSVPSQTFAIVDTVSQNLLTNPVSGLLGLGFQSIATSHALPLWQAMVQSNIWTDPLFALYLTRFLNASHADTQEPGGRMTLGFADPTLHSGDIEYTSIPVGASGYWLIPLTSLTVNENPINIGTTTQSSLAAIDSGTTLIGGPPAVIKEIFQAIPGSSPATGNYQGYYTYPCSSAVRITLAFGGGTAWPIEPEDFTLAQLESDLCLGAFFSLDMGPNGPTWIIGDTFLKNVYSVFRFDPPSVGFARLSTSALSLAVAGGPLPSQTIGENPAVATNSNSHALRCYTINFPTLIWSSAAAMFFYVL